MEKKNPPVYRNIIVGFSLIIILFILAGIISLVEINILGNLTSRIYKHPLEVSNAALRASIGVVKMHRGIKDVVLADDQLSLVKTINLVDNDEISVLQELDLIRDKILGARGHDLEKEARELFIKWKPIREEVIRLAKNGEKAKAADINRGRGAEHQFLLEQKMSALTSYARHKADSFINQAAGVQKRVTLTTSIIIVVGVLLSLLIAYFTSTQIINSFSQRRKAEETLRHEQEFTQKIIDSQRDTFFVFEHETGRAIRWNNRFREISGYTDQEISELKAPDSYYSAEDLQKAISKTEEVIKYGLATVEMSFITKDGEGMPTEYIASSVKDEQGNPQYIISIGRDITERKRADDERKKMISDLQQALDEIKTLRGIIPICSFCKQIRDDKGLWNRLEAYIHNHSEAEFSHSICPDCTKKHYADLNDEDEE